MNKSHQKTQVEREPVSIRIAQLFPDYIFMENFGGNGVVVFDKIMEKSVKEKLEKHAEEKPDNN